MEESLSQVVWMSINRKTACHMIGGRQRLIHRLVEFFESGYKVEEHEHDAA